MRRLLAGALLALALVTGCARAHGHLGTPFPVLEPPPPGPWQPAAESRRFRITSYIRVMASLIRAESHVNYWIEVRNETGRRLDLVPTAHLGDGESPNLLDGTPAFGLDPRSPARLEPGGALVLSQHYPFQGVLFESDPRVHAVVQPIRLALRWRGGEERLLVTEHRVQFSLE